MLDFTGSQLAASALILAINQNAMSQYIFNIEQGKNFDAQYKFLFGSNKSDEDLGALMEFSDMDLPKTESV